MYNLIKIQKSNLILNIICIFYYYKFKNIILYNFIEFIINTIYNLNTLFKTNFKNVRRTFICIN